MGEGTLYLGSLHLCDMQLKMRMLVDHLREEAGEEIGGYGGEDADTEGALDALAFFIDDFFDALGASEHLPCLLHHFLAYRRGEHLLRVALKKFDVELLLQLLNHHTQGGLGDAAVAGCLGKMSSLIDCNDIF